MKSIHVDEKLFKTKYIDDNLSLEQMADFFKFSTGTVKKWIRKLGLRKSPEAIRARMRQTNFERYGVEFPAQNKEIRNKQKSTCRKKYGCDSPLANEQIQARVRQTNLERYGVDYPSQNKDILMKKKRVTISREAYEILLNPSKLEQFIIDKGVFTLREISQQLGCRVTTLAARINRYELNWLITYPCSSGEDELSKLLLEWGIESRKDRKTIAPYEIDIFCAKEKIGIEFNGMYWHSVEKVGRQYHFKKFYMAQKQGVFLYQVFEYEWCNLNKKQIVIAQLAKLFGYNIHKISLAECRFGYVGHKEKQDFLKSNHIKGADRSSVAMGLYYNKELVLLMTWCRTSLANNIRWELSRCCAKLGCVVDGGFSYLFERFLCAYNGGVVAYDDNAKSQKEVLSSLGFVYQRELPPKMTWSNYLGECKTSYQMQTLMRAQKMAAHGYFKVYDCGWGVWIYNKNIKGE